MQKSATFPGRFFPTVRTVFILLTFGPLYLVTTIIVSIPGIKFEVQSDKVPATHEVEQWHECLSWADSVE